MYEADIKRQMETINNKIFELIKENVSNKRIAERYAKRYLKIEQNDWVLLPEVMDKTVLDIGSYLAIDNIKLKSLGAKKVISLDIDMEALKINKRCGVGEVVCADALHLPFRDDGFEVVTSFSAIEHISEGHEQWISEMVRVTKKGGAHCGSYFKI